MRALIGKRALDRTAASSGTVSRFETEILTQDENIDALASLNSAWVSKAVSFSLAKKIILGIDSSESPVHGSLEGSAHNGFFESTCYHPLFCFNNYGDCEGAVLRPGNVHSAKGWKQFLTPIVDRYKEMDKKLYLRGDAAFASPDIYEYLEENSILYAIRLKANFSTPSPTGRHHGTGPEGLWPGWSGTHVSCSPGRLHRHQHVVLT